MGKWEKDLGNGDILEAIQVVALHPSPRVEAQRIVTECDNVNVRAFFTQLVADIDAHGGTLQRLGYGVDLARIADAAQGIEDRSAFSLDVRTDPEGLQVVVDQDGQVAGV